MLADKEESRAVQNVVYAMPVYGVQRFARKENKAFQHGNEIPNICKTFKHLHLQEVYFRMIKLLIIL